MAKILSTIIGFIFFGSIVSAQLTEFSQGDILSAGAMNQNFKHLQDQFFWNKKEIDCSTDNLTGTINDGYNHIVINGSCSIKSLTTGGWDFTKYCSDNGDHKPISRIKIIGKTGSSSDSITIGNVGNCGALFGSFGGFMHLENIKIITEAVNVNDGGFMRIENSSIHDEDSDNKGINLYNNATFNMQNSSALHEIKINSGSVGEFQNSTTSNNVSVEFGSTIVTDNMSMLTLYIKNHSTANISKSSILNVDIRGNSSAQIKENSTINCSAKDLECVKLERISSINIDSSTITGGANKDAIKIGPTSQVNLYQSTVNSTKSSSIKVDGPLSYLDVYSSTINGTVSCGNIESHAFKGGTDLCN